MTVISDEHNFQRLATLTVFSFFFCFPNEHRNWWQWWGCDRLLTEPFIAFEIDVVVEWLNAICCWYNCRCRCKNKCNLCDCNPCLRCGQQSSHTTTFFFKTFTPSDTNNYALFLYRMCITILSVHHKLS